MQDAAASEAVAAILSKPEMRQPMALPTAALGGSARPSEADGQRR